MPTSREYGLDSPGAKHPYAEDLRKFFGSDDYSEQTIRSLRRGYYGCITLRRTATGAAGGHAGEVRAGVQHGEYVYTSNHGEMLGKFGLWWKRSLYEDSVRIPMIAAETRVPGRPACQHPCRPARPPGINVRSHGRQRVFPAR
ncbi:MAG: hypothetical protein QM757_14885 [Paludibaculum sp.]